MLEEARQLAIRALPGAGAVSIALIASSPYSDVYRAQREGCVYSLRMPSSAATAPTPAFLPHADWGCRVLAVAGAAQFAPTLVYCDATRGVVVSQWIEGAVPDSDEVGSFAGMRAMADTLHGIQALEIPGSRPTMTAATWIERYRAELRRVGAEIPRFHDREHEAVAAIAATAAPRAYVLCHSDLHRLNVLMASRWVLLDWEYAHIGDPWWDVAGWAANNDWCSADAQAFLGCYLGRKPSMPECRELAAWMWLFDYVCALWCLLHASEPNGVAAPLIGRRGELLLERLRRPFR